MILPDAFVGVLDVKANISSDGIHPNALGYRRLAQNVLEQGFSMLNVVPVGPAPVANHRQ
jgi:lysophospholipase L1-like esterase